MGSPVFCEPPVVWSRSGVEFAGFDRVVSRVYRAGGRFLCTRVGVVAVALVALGGTAAAVGTLAGSGGPVGFSAAATLWILVVAGWVGVVCHETAHALVMCHGGRRVGRAGFGFYWGSLTFFVDSTDALFLGRRRRAAQAAAGPVADATLAGVCGLVAVATAGQPVGVVAAQLALLAWFDVAINLVPFLKLDGYWLVADLRNTPDLAERSRRALFDVSHPNRPHGGVGLAVYAAASMLFGVVLLVGVAVAWTVEFAPLVAAAWGQGVWGVLGAVAFCGPFVAGVVLAVLRVGVDRLTRPEPDLSVATLRDPEGR